MSLRLSENAENLAVLVQNRGTTVFVVLVHVNIPVIEFLLGNLFFKSYLVHFTNHYTLEGII